MSYCIAIVSFGVNIILRKVYHSYSSALHKPFIADYVLAIHNLNKIWQNKHKKQPLPTYKKEIVSLKIPLYIYLLKGMNKITLMPGKVRFNKLYLRCCFFFVNRLW